MALAVDILITEKDAGILARDYVCGISLVSFLVSQLFLFLAIACCQILFSLLLLVSVFPTLPVHVILFLALLLLLQVVWGMTRLL
jgi:hypothetical protein